MSTIALPQLDASDVQILTTSRYATVSVTTQNSNYLVVIRPGWVVVVCPDGRSLKGTDVRLVGRVGGGIGTRLFLRDNWRDVTLLRTTAVKSLYVLEN